MTKKELIKALVRHPGSLDAPVVFRDSAGGFISAGPPNFVALISTASPDGRFRGFMHRGEDSRVATLRNQDTVMTYENVDGIEL